MKAINVAKTLYRTGIGKRIIGSIVTSRLYGRIHSRYYWATHRQHIVDFPQEGNRLLKREELAEKKPLKNYYQNKISAFVRFNALKKVAILGCSYGHEAAYLVDEFPGINVIGLDLDPTCINFCKSMNLPNTSFHIVNIEDANALRYVIDGIAGGGWLRLKPSIL